MSDVYVSDKEGGELNLSEWNYALIPEDRYLKWLEARWELISSFWEYQGMGQAWEFKRILRSRILQWLGCVDEQILLWAGSYGVWRSVLIEYLYAQRGMRDLIGVWPQFPDIVSSFGEAKGTRVNIIEADNFDLNSWYNLLIKQFEKWVFWNSIVYVDSPNNPTGQVIDVNLIKRLILGNKRGFVVVDEAFGDFISRDNSALSLINDPELSWSNFIVLRSLSKAYGLWSERVWYGVTPLWLNLQTISMPFVPNRGSLTIWSKVLGEANIIGRLWGLQEFNEELLLLLQNTDYVSTSSETPILMLKDAKLITWLQSQWVQWQWWWSFASTYATLNDSKFMRITAPATDKAKAKLVRILGELSVGDQYAWLNLIRSAWDTNSNRVRRFTWSMNEYTDVLVANSTALDEYRVSQKIWAFVQTLNAFTGKKMTPWDLPTIINTWDHAWVLGMPMQVGSNILYSEYVGKLGVPMLSFSWDGVPLNNKSWPDWISFSGNRKKDYVPLISRSQYKRCNFLDSIVLNDRKSISKSIHAIEFLETSFKEELVSLTNDMWLSISQLVYQINMLIWEKMYWKPFHLMPTIELMLEYYSRNKKIFSNLFFDNIMKWEMKRANLSLGNYVYDNTNPKKPIKIPIQSSWIDFFYEIDGINIWLSWEEVIELLESNRLQLSLFWAYIWLVDMWLLPTWGFNQIKYMQEYLDVYGQVKWTRKEMVELMKKKLLVFTGFSHQGQTTVRALLSWKYDPRDFMKGSPSDNLDPLFSNL